jgi:hypothetical protein
MRCRNISWRKLLLMAVTGLSVLPAPAVAQSASGKFTLVREVRWGNVSLPPGDYSCSVEHRSAETVLLHDLTNRSGAIVMASSVSTVDNPTESQLVLEQKGNEWFVRSLVLSGTGEVLYFNPPATRTETGQLARLGPRKTSTVSNP